MGRRKIRLESTKQISIDDALAKAKKPRKINWLNDSLTQKIIGAVKDRCHKAAIVRRTGQDDGTVRNRLKRLEKAGYIKHHEERIGGTRRNIYVLTPKGAQVFSICEEAEQKQRRPQKLEEKKFVFDGSHANTFKFKILEPDKVKFAPQAGKIYKMQNWEGRTFESEDGSHFIRTTPKHVIVYVNVELGADKVMNLIIKYTELAKTYAFRFSQRYNIKLNPVPEAYRDPHFTIQDNALAQLVTEFGSVMTDTGVTIDKSRKKDLEMRASTAIGFEQLSTETPRDINSIKNEVGDVKQKIAQIENNVNGVTKNVSELPILISTLHENLDLKMQLRECHRIYQEQMAQLRHELDQMKMQIQQITGGAGMEEKKPPATRDWETMPYA